MARGKDRRREWFSRRGRDSLQNQGWKWNFHSQFEYFLRFYICWLCCKNYFSVCPLLSIMYFLLPDKSLVYHNSVILFCIRFCRYRQLARWNVARQMDCCHSGWYAVSSVWTYTTGDREWLWYFDFSPGKEWTVSLHGQVVMNSSSTSVICFLMQAWDTLLLLMPFHWSHQIFPHVAVNIYK